MSIKNNLKSIKLSVVDARKRRLISKNVALRHGKSCHKVSLWKYTIFLAMLVIFMAGGYVLESKKSDQAMAVESTTFAQKDTKNFKLVIDDEASISVALDLAEQANLPVAQDVAILSEMNAIKKEVSLQNAELTVAKAAPIFDLASTNRSVKFHRVQPGQTIQQIADQYQISTNTIKWANNLKDDNLTVNTDLKILPVDGIVYKVKAGDTIEKIAEKYKANIQRIQILNDIEVKGLAVGSEVVIPEGILPNEERPGYVAPRPVARTSYSSWNSGLFSASGSGGRVNITRIPNLSYRRNTYADGNCTWHAYEWRARNGRPVGPFWGNGSSWAYSANKAGFKVNRTPAPGAVFQTSAGWFGYGHVGIVEQVLPNGDIVVTEMNYGGYNVTTRATIQAKYVPTYNYIH